MKLTCLRASCFSNESLYCRYAGEIQLIHYKSNYSDYEAGLQEEDDVVALSTFLEISPFDNLGLTPIISALEDVQSAGNLLLPPGKELYIYLSCNFPI